MAGIQTIINYCNGININRRRLVGIQYTMNEVPRTTLNITTNPWRFNLTMPSSFKYNEARNLMEALDTIDRYVPEVVTFSSNPCLNWIYRYQGTLNSGELNAITVQSFSGQSLVLTNLPAVSSSTIMFEPNDLIQIGSFTYPYTSQTQVLRGSGSTVTVTTHRPNIIADPVATLGITVGNGCSFNVFCPNMPTYKLIPGGYQKSGSTVVGNALIEFSSEFELYEYVSGAMT